MFLFIEKKNIWSENFMNNENSENKQKIETIIENTETVVVIEENTIYEIDLECYRKMCTNKKK